MADALPAPSSDGDRARAARILRWINGQPGAALSDRDVPLVLGALLVRMARADHVYVLEEIAAIDEILALRFGLAPQEAAAMRRLCEEIEAKAPGYEPFAALIRDAVSYDERLNTSLALWQVMMADGVRRIEESALIATVERVLGILPDDLPGA